jgi:hypothetical protein
LPSFAKQIERLPTGAAESLASVVGGPCSLGDQHLAFYWVAAGIIVSLVVSVWNAWVPLIEIRR